MNNELVADRKNFLDRFFIGPDLISCLHTIDINPTELCNRTCEFCPRVDSTQYPNQNLHMSLETARVLGQQLSTIEFNNQIHFGGQCEPLLTHRFESIVSTIKSFVPNNHHFHLTTNGDRLTESKLYSLIDSGINHINVSCYDSEEQARHFDDLLHGKISYTVKHFYHNSTVQWGLPAVSNRAGKLERTTEVKQQSCNLPFYSSSIDWNGNVYLCVHDWNKHKIFGNIHYRSLKDIWLSNELNSYRKMLIKGLRCNSPCSKCDVDGNFYGIKNFEAFSEKISTL